MLVGDDISQPLKNSFIHAGHADAKGQIWGDPGQIDESVFLTLLLILWSIF